jgi:hypothetical protein
MFGRGCGGWEDLPGNVQQNDLPIALSTHRPGWRTVTPVAEQDYRVVVEADGITTHLELVPPSWNMQYINSMVSGPVPTNRQSAGAALEDPSHTGATLQAETGLRGTPDPHSGVPNTFRVNWAQPSSGCDLDPAYYVFFPSTDGPAGCN